MTNLQQVKTNALTTADFSDEQIALIKRTVAKGATDDELKIFLHHAKKSGLDPLAKQIYFMKFKDKNDESKMTITVGIDGYRLTAERTGLYAGNDDPIFDDEKTPTKATVTVYKMVAGVRCPFTASARWEQYLPSAYNKQFMWKKMPHVMLGKVAEALALRKAFPAELSGIYTQDEMDQAEQKAPSVIEAEISQVKAIEAPVDRETLDKLIEAFANIEIDISEIEGWIGKKINQFDGADIGKLRGYFYQRKAEYQSE